MPEAKNPQTKSEYVHDALIYFRDEYKKANQTGLTYEYFLGEHDDDPDTQDEDYSNRIDVLELLKIKGIILGYTIEQQSVDITDYSGVVCDFAICSLDEQKLFQTDVILSNKYQIASDGRVFNLGSVKISALDPTTQMTKEIMITLVKGCNEGSMSAKTILQKTKDRLLEQGKSFKYAPTDITSSIRNINDTFARTAGVKLIKSTNGYHFNSKELDLAFD